MNILTSIDMVNINLVVDGVLNLTNLISVFEFKLQFSKDMLPD